MRDEQIDDQFDDLTEADEISAAVATEEPDGVDTAPSEWTGPRCEKCEAPLKSEVTVCRSCGWYPSLGRFLEVDPNWESVNDSSQPAAPAPQKSHLRVWFELLPKWSYVIIASVLVIIVESVIARFTTERLTAHDLVAVANGRGISGRVRLSYL